MGSSPPQVLSRPAQKLDEHAAQLFYERRVILFAFFAAAPGLIVAGVLIWLQPWTAARRISVLAALCFVVLLLVRILHNQIVRPLQTMANVIAALREEDFSFRARGAASGDPLGELALEINTLADVLARESTRTIEATALLRKVIEVVDVPMFALDPQGCVRLINSAGERLLRKPAAALLGRSAEELGLGLLMSANNETQIVLPQTQDRRWFVRRNEFRQNGVPHTLLALSDLSRPLREEERSAWQRLIRVLGHELNNSLAPIKSIAGTLAKRVSTLALTKDQQQDFARGLSIIEARAASLNRFLQAYRRLAQMPRPELAPVEVPEMVKRVATLETRVPVNVEGGPELSAMLDSDQIEQLLINLVKNAAEAALEGASRSATAQLDSVPEVLISWSAKGTQLALEIKDNGPGLFNPENVFVPFYTTKPEGTGIGLVFSRQIAEAHHGSIQLANRVDRRGCVATVLLPIRASENGQRQRPLSDSHLQN